VRIVHINSFDSGGAFNAAYRLFKTQKYNDVEASFLCLHKYKNRDDVKYFNSKIDYPVLRKLLWKLGFPYTKEHHQIILTKKLPQEVEKYSIAETDYDISTLELVQEADILHFHWINSFVNLGGSALKDKKIVWTLHDLNPLSGGFHYKLDETKYQSLVTLEEKKISDIKEAFFQGHHIHFVSPSKWLYNHCCADERISSNKCHLIPYGIDTTIFKTNHNHTISDRKKILLIAADNSSIRKGSEFVESIFNDFSDKIDFVVVGSSKFSPKINQLGYIDSLYRLVDIYNSVDFVLMLSIEDNLPNIVLESMSCGTPIIGFPVGGLIEHIHGDNGILADEVSYNAMHRCLTKVINEKPAFNRDSIRKYALRHFDERLQFDSYINVYKQVLSE
jgi:glycosyltransferase involved in cell wall biosynthesis